MEITIKGENGKLLKEVENLARKLGLKIVRNSEMDKSQGSSTSKKLYDLMTEKAKSGGIESIKDPSAWQREQRIDKKLYGRD